MIKKIVDYCIPVLMAIVIIGYMVQLLAAFPFK
ncbi:hypothetical protein UFOVP938_59 [uncultured Caudovirales phage]|uniref:Uncharacterized protein n=1 Tax=uncultured Caudovirales phage TaxID=2100421 RepID=A0A6J5SJR9_9CAUD|nr:hypothetical protein UFOVP596_46 [uncultured Caudovirales phage]CAB4172722.1 hypothetical protein UFOVP938_59 [uncultured Caudovirales phage]CAB4183618.1 hypothetical protein UFOVP1104_42 [uncultured Caudovirales phage]CAB4202971.1 hypothetical protein UFOVP1371_55 [uncultured Caudovirales phage]CAB4214741.1 hypothetical protein UFOVP1468_2 [uncultured Caudovirales phage]